MPEITPPINIQPEPEFRKCSMSGCEGRHEARGLCGKHYKRLRVWGSPHYVSPRTGEHGNTYKHGMLNTPEYRAWHAMKVRCNNKNAPNYRLYGGRGIRVCESWNGSFETFFSDMGKRPSKYHQLDRIDNDGDYKPENCRWATATQQANNRRSNRLLTVRGKTKTVAEWSREVGVEADTIRKRLASGMSDEEAIESGNLRSKCSVEHVVMPDSYCFSSVTIQELQERGLWTPHKMESAACKAVTRIRMMILQSRNPKTAKISNSFPHSL